MRAIDAKAVFELCEPGTWYMPTGSIVVGTVATVGGFVRLSMAGSDHDSLAQEVKLATLDIEYWWGFPNDLGLGLLW